MIPDRLHACRKEPLARIYTVNIKGICMQIHNGIAFEKAVPSAWINLVPVPAQQGDEFFLVLRPDQNINIFHHSESRPRIYHFRKRCALENHDPHLCFLKVGFQSGNAALPGQVPGGNGQVVLFKNRYCFFRSTTSFY